MNSKRLDHAALGMMPADEGFKTCDLLCLHIDQRLVEQLKFAIRDGIAQIDLKFPPSLHPGVHFRLKETVEAVTVRLGTIQRHVGVFQKLVRIEAVARRERDSNAQFDRNLIAGKLVRGADHLDET